MNGLSLLYNAEFIVVENAAVAATSSLTTDVVDCSDCDGVTFVAKLGDVTTGCVLGLTAYHSDANGSGSVALAGPLAFTAGASDADNKLLILDVVKPEKRYVHAVLARGTANAVVDSIIAIKHNVRKVPITQGTTVLASDVLANPEAA